MAVVFFFSAENYSIPLLLLNFELLALEEHIPPLFSHLQSLLLSPTFLEGASNGKRLVFWGEIVAEAPYVKTAQTMNMAQTPASCGSQSENPFQVMCLSVS